MKAYAKCQVNISIEEIPGDHEFNCFFIDTLNRTINGMPDTSNKCRIKLSMWTMIEDKV